jgi:bifunctional non-homologous end joining protein LigD
MDSLPKGTPGFIEPMKCRLREKLPVGDDWSYEIKFDGYRALAIKDGREAHLISRNNKEMTGKFPAVKSAVQDLPCKQLVLDGEVVALDAAGKSSFQMLQRSGEPGLKSAGLFYYAFDILQANGRDTTSLPLHERKALLKTLLQPRKDEPHGDCIRVSEALHGNPAELSAAMQQLGLEGIIAKQRNSKYEPGQRSGAWVKFKWGFEQEFVIGGYTDPEGSRPYFGSVLVGHYEGERLIFAAKVGTGFDAKRLKSLYDHFQKIRIEKTPFSNLPERGNGVTAAQMRFC